jgi:hypothetical protein
MCLRTGTIVALAAWGLAAASAEAGAQESTPAAAAGTSWWALAGWWAGALAALAALSRVEWFRGMPRIGPAWPLRAEASLFGWAAAFMVAVLAGSLASAATGESSPELKRLAAQSWATHGAQLAVALALLAVPGARPRGGGTVPGRGGVHFQPRGRAEAVAMAAAFALLLYPVASAASATASAVQQWLGAAAPAVGHRTLQAMAASGAGDPWWWASVLSAALLAPLAEEWCYRGLLQQGLKGIGLGRGTAAVATGALFALMHWGALPEGARAPGLAALAVLGIGWGVLYERTGRIAAPVVAHALFNAANLAMAA